MRCLHVLDGNCGSVLAVGNEGAFPFMTSCYSQLGAGVRRHPGRQPAVGVARLRRRGHATAVHVTEQGHICITDTVVGTGSGPPTTGTIR